LYECRFGSFYYVHVTRKKAAETTLVQKILEFNVNEIGTSYVFGSISPTFYQQLLSEQVPKAQKHSQVVTCFWDLYAVKAACRTLMKLTLGVNFTNILHADFPRENHKSVKRH